MFMFDVETLGVESTSVVLSASIIHFDSNDTVDYDQLLQKALFVKLDVDTQVKQYNRIIDKETLEWWDKQHDFVKRVSLKPSADDLHPTEAVRKLREYVNSYGGDKTIWARGSLDQMSIDSLAVAVGEEKIVMYNMWRDVRTAVDLLCETAKDGYCEVAHPTFKRHNVIKHHPTHDCALDVMMLLYGK